MKIEMYNAFLGNDSYKVQRYNEPESAIRKYKSSDLYPLPPYIFPHEPVNTMDVLFLNYSQAPLVSPLQKSMKIEM